MSKGFDSIESVIADIRRGRMVIVVDDADRENEGDLVMAAEKVTARSVNFMAKHGRGLICVPTAGDRLRQLGIERMVTHNRETFKTDFQVSVDAAEGITTGISAADRAKTIQVLAEPRSFPEDLVQPGHVFPLRAKAGGVLQRAGHTEAAVDLARLAECRPAGVICEIMKDDGTMARLPDLVTFCQKHNLKLGTIADLIAYRLRNDSVVTRTVETKLVRSHGGEFDVIIYESQMNGLEHVAVVKGDLSGEAPVLVRMHALNVLDDVLHDTGEERQGELEMSLRMVAEEGRGAVVLIRDSWNTRFSTQIAMRKDVSLQAENSKTSDDLESKPQVLRNYGIGAQILRDLGISRMKLLTNTRESSIKGIDGYGLKIVERVPIPRFGH